MKISITDTGSGIAQEFAKAIGATVRGRFIDIPESKGGGYITGFCWGNDLRMMVRNYYLHEDVFIERTNTLADDQYDVVFLLSGIDKCIIVLANHCVNPVKLKCDRCMISDLLVVEGRPLF